MYKNILVPLDLRDDHDPTISFSAAKQLADDDANFTVLHVSEPIPGYVASEVSKDVLTAAQHGLQEKLDELAKALPNAKTKLVSGRPGTAIVDFANANKTDCIVLASHKPGIQDLFLGSTANRVVHHAKCSVHVIR